MAKVTKSTLKSYFETGDQPTEQEFIDVFDSTLISTGSNSLTGSLTISGSRTDNADGTAVKLTVMGDITASGNISSSGTIYANNFQSTGGDVAGIDFLDDIKITGNITASGDVSSSGIVTATEIQLDNGSFIYWTVNQDQYIKGQNNKIVIDGDDMVEIRADQFIEFQDTSNVPKVSINPNAGEISSSGNVWVGSGSSDVYLRVEGHITASGNISASGTIYADNFQSTGGDVAGINFTDDLAITGNITASGDISASGNVISNRVYPNGLNDAFIGTFGGQIQSSTGFTGGHITASGNISASGEVLASTYKSHGTNVIGFSTNTVKVSETYPIILNHSSTTATNITASGDISASGTITGNSIVGTIGTATQGTIDHDSLANFVANEHIDHSGVSITAGAGLTGGGTIASTRDIAVGAGVGVTVNANDIAIGQDVATTANVLFNHITASGNISASGNIYGDDLIATGELFTTGTGVNKIEGILTLGSANVPAGGNKLLVTGTSTFTSHITASGIISASSDVYADAYVVDGNVALDTNGHQGRVFSSTNIIGIQIGRNGQTNRNIELLGPVTASGNISASGIVYTNQINSLAETLILDSDDLYHKGLSFRTDGHITASGTISASGNIFADDITAVDLVSAARFGSTAGVSFGNSNDDSHNFVGNITASGNISASGDITGVTGSFEYAKINQFAMSASGEASADAVTYTVHGTKFEIRNQLQTVLSPSSSAAEFLVTNEHIKANSVFMGNLIPEADGVESKFTVASAIMSCSVSMVPRADGKGLMTLHYPQGSGSGFNTQHIPDNTGFTASFVTF